MMHMPTFCLGLLPGAPPRPPGPAAAASLHSLRSWKSFKTSLNRAAAGADGLSGYHAATEELAEHPHVYHLEEVWSSCPAHQRRACLSDQQVLAMFVTCCCLQMAPSEVAFRGLAVRMAIAYGKVSKSQQNHVMRME